MELEVARWIARENPTARRVYFSHLPNPAMYSYFDRKNSMKRHQELEGFCLVWAEVILTPSQYSKRVLTSTYSVNEARIKVLPHGGILPGTKPTNNRQPKSFATVGRFTEQKGWGTLVNLIDAMKENGVTQRWFIIGDGRLRPTLVEMIRKRLPHENVQFFRMMDPNEFPELFRSVKYYVQTSDYESFGLAAMEAALNGCVPILTDIPPFREVFGAHKSVCFFQPGHFSEVLSLVNLDSSKDTDSAEANAEEFFSHCWTWERHINELSHLLY
jgi:glycosyltransferase involved in cell wall biosynthesis